jgi:O-antigen ligase
MAVYSAERRARSRSELISPEIRERMLNVLALAVLAAGCVQIGLSLTTGRSMFAVGLTLLPLFIFLVWKLATGARALILFLALGVHLVPFTAVTVEPLLGSVYLSDVILVLAIGVWLLERLMGGPDAFLPSSPIIGLPLALFGAALLPGIVEGHERFGSSFLGQPARFVLYAGIITALAGVSPRDAYRGIVAVFYCGTTLQTMAALYYLATGTSQTDAVGLSTGGTRVLALSTGMYLTGALVLAMLNLQIDPRRWPLHIAVGLMALFGVVIAFGRVNYVAVAVLVPLLLIALPIVRRVAALSLAVVLPLVVLAALFLPTFSPDFFPTLGDRVNPSVERDASYLWRERATEVVLEGSSDDRLAGTGFGARYTFTVYGATHEISGDPHNTFIYLLSGGGIIAFGTFVLLLLIYMIDAVRRLKHAVRQDRCLIIFSLSFFLVFVLNTLAGPVLTDPVFLLTFWVILFLPSLVKVEESRIRSGTRWRSGAARTALESRRDA